MRLTADGKRWGGALGEEEKELPGFELPEGYSLGTSWSISPDDKQIVLHLQRNANGAWSDDLWVGSMEGGPLQRLTRTTISSYALWSPDGRFIAFNTDPDLHAACGISFSPARWHQNARVHYVDASARDVEKLEQAHAFESLGTTGKYRLLGWTPQ